MHALQQVRTLRGVRHNTRSLGQSPSAGVKHAVGHAHAQPKGPLPQPDTDIVYGFRDLLLLGNAQRLDHRQQLSRAGGRERQDKTREGQPLLLRQLLALPKVYQPCNKRQ